MEVTLPAKNKLSIAFEKTSKAIIRNNKKNTKDRLRELNISD
jgi:hypothetical protein